MSRYYTPPIPNGWFMVAYADEIAPGEVKPLRYFGKDLVAFRTEAGKLTVLDAHCPHLGAHLGHGGKVVGDNIECPFHAWKFDPSGKCAEVPYAKRIPPKANLACWPVHEVAGMVMVWHHAGGLPPQWELPEVPEYGHEEWTSQERRYWKIKTRNQEMAENAVDSAHFHYVHGAKNMPQSQAEFKDHTMRVFSDTGMETPRGKVDGSVESMSHGFGFATVRFKGIVETLLINSVSPIDSEYVDVFFAFQVKKIGGADVTKGVGKAFIAEIERQLGQDIPIWENKIQWEKPMLCDGDGPIAQYRRWCQQFYTFPEEPPGRQLDVVQSAPN